MTIPETFVLAATGPEGILRKDKEKKFAWAAEVFALNKDDDDDDYDWPDDGDGENENDENEGCPFEQFERMTQQLDDDVASRLAWGIDDVADLLNEIEEKLAGKQAQLNVKGKTVVKGETMEKGKNEAKRKARRSRVRAS